MSPSCKTRLRMLLVVMGCLFVFNSVALAKVELTIMVSNAMAWLNFHQEALAAFEKENPDIKVNMIAGTIQNLKVNVAGNVPPDVFYLPGDTFTETAEPGLLMNLQTFINQDKAFKLHEFYPAAVDAHRYKGVLYGIPQVVSPVATLYNRTLFNEAGVAYPSKSLNWDTLIAYGKKLSLDKDGDGHPDQYAWSYANWSQYNRWPAYIWQNGGDVFSPDGSRVVLDKPEAVEALQFYGDLAMVHDVAPRPSDPILAGTNYAALFNNGKAAMVTQTRFFNPPSTLDYNIAHLPIGKQAATTLITNYYGMLATTKHPNEAWRLIHYLLVVPTKKGLLDKAAPAIPAYRPNAVSFIKAELAEANGTHNELVWLEAMEYARGPYYPPIADWPGIVNKHFGNFASGKVSAQVMAEQLTQETNALLLEKATRKN